MTPKWYTANNMLTGAANTFRSNNPIGVAFEMFGQDKYSFTEISEGYWIVDNKLEIRKLKNINPFWGLK